MKNEEIYEQVMGHKPNKGFGVKGSFGWDDIDNLMTEAVKNCSVPDVVERSEQLVCDYCGKAKEEEFYTICHECHIYSIQ